MALRIVGAGRTDVGIVRAGNEDNYLLIPDEGAYIVADGMGGHAAGEIASEMAVRIVARELVGASRDTHAVAGDRLREALRTANNLIFQRTVEEQDKRGMGTTVTAMLVNGSKYLIGQVGDSRAYVLRNGNFDQLTKDHSYVQEQVDAGCLTADEARVHPYSNVITRCVGVNEDVWPDIYTGTLHENDLYMLASDGLTGMLEDYEVKEILTRDTDLEQKLGDLISEGNARGGLDNITAILVRVEAV